MPNVMMPQQRPDQVKQVIPMAASVVGSIYGGPAGGAAAGKLAGGLTKDEPQAGAVQSTAGSPSAIDRRIGTMQDEPSMQLAQADAALSQLPPEYAQQYGPAIAAARKMNAQEGVG